MNAAQRVVMLGIDGVPFSFVTEQMRAGRFPNMQQLLVEGDMARMRSALPCVSSVAWTSIMTGRNPAGHGIFGFVDRRTNPLEMYLPTSLDRRAPALWDTLGDRGRRVIVMNVPVNYPPRPVNGKLVSCFLATDLKKATYPPELADTLENLGYVIDVDPWKARSEPDAFLDDLFHALDRRLDATLYLMENEPWYFFVSHVMETDRIAHFFWEQWENNHPVYAPRFDAFFDRVDAFIGEVRARMPEDATLIVLSDHGFCALKKEVFINRALSDAGLLRFTCEQPKELSHIAPESRVYSLIPGRFYMNLRGREQNGTVAPGADAEKVLEETTELLLSLRDPSDNSPVIRRVYRRDEIFSGPFLNEAPDLVADPHDGYDIKGALHSDTLFKKTELTGMHTLHDALFYAQRQVINAENLTLLDVAPSILSLYGIKQPELEGRNAFAPLQ